MNMSGKVRMLIGMALLFISAPFVLPNIEWGSSQMIWLLLWGAGSGLLAYPLAAV